MKLSKEDTQELYQICLDSNEDARHTLVGIIEEETQIVEKLKTSKVIKTINNHCKDYIKNIDSGIYRKVLEENDFDTIFNLTGAWYNKQVHMEHNPIHNHNTSADLVTVIYPKINLDNNVEHYIVNNTTQNEQKGQINFMYGQDVNLNGFGTSQVTVDPEEGDLLIFPASTLHYTSPVLGDSYRYSISCNWMIHNHIKRLQAKMRTSN